MSTVMFARQLAIIFLLFLLLITPPHWAFSAEELQHVADSVTGTTLVVPRSLVGREKQTKFGLNWQNEDVSIATLAFPRERSLLDIYGNIKKHSGRRVTRDEYDVTAFLVEGVDRDGSRFIVIVRTQDDSGTTRGISVVYSSKGGRELQRTARDIADSFQVVLDPQVPTANYLVKAREILSKVDRDPSKAKELWADFGELARKYRLRVGRTAATEAIQALFSEYPTSPLRSVAWGSLPLGVIAGLAQHRYDTNSIFGAKTAYPGIRRELVRFLSAHPDDPFAFVAAYGIGEFDRAIALARTRKMPVGMLHFAAGHKKLAGLLERAIPNLEKIATTPRVELKEGGQEGNRDCPTDDVRSRCYFYQTYAVRGNGDRLLTFLNRAAKTDRIKVRYALESSAADLRHVIDHLERAALLSRGLLHDDDANYYLGVIFWHLGRRSEAIDRFATALSERGEGPKDYAGAALRQVIKILFEVPEAERIAVVKDSKGLSREAAIWYVLARDAYRRNDYEATIRIAEMGLGSLGVEVWRLPVTTESSRIEDELKRALTKQSYVSLNLIELVYLLNASREMQRFVRALQDRPSSINGKHVRSLILKYSLLTATGKEEEKLYAGQLGQHRDLRQAIYLTELTLKTFPATVSPEFDSLREWLHYRKVRMLVQFEPKMVQTAVSELERAYPRSTLLDDAYVELLYAQAFKLRAPDAAVGATFRLFAERFPASNAADNAYNWYAVYLRCMRDYDNARRINTEIIRRFPLTRQAVYAAARLVQQEGCELWPA